MVRNQGVQILKALKYGVPFNSGDWLPLVDVSPLFYEGDSFSDFLFYFACSMSKKKKKKKKKKKNNNKLLSRGFPFTEAFFSD